MKKVILFAATAAMALSFASCNKAPETKPDSSKDPSPDPSETPAPEAWEAKTAKDNLVLHLGFDSDADIVRVGEGVTFDKFVGDGALADGFIGKSYVNKSGDNTKEAYAAFKLASENVFSKLTSFTITAWVNVPGTATAKGAILSVNGGEDGNWPAFNVIYDNTDAETGAQDFNTRFEFKKGDESIALWGNVRGELYGTRDSYVQVGITVDLASGQWRSFAGGVPVQEEYMVNDELKVAVPNYVSDKTNAFYIGAWATLIAGTGDAGWQNYFAGSIDEVRIYNKALSVDEIAALCNEEIAQSLAE